MGRKPEEAYCAGHGWRQEMRGILAAVSLLVAFVVGPAFADPAAEAFVNGIYKNYVKAGGMTGMGVPLDNEAVIRKYFEPSLAKMMIDDQKASQGEVGALDGDPFVNAQDWEIKSFTANVVDNGPNKATATVRFRSIDRQENIVLSLVKVGGQWRIYDINWGENGTLRALFQH